MESSLTQLVVGLATALALVGVGGGLYEFIVVDHAWPRRPDIVQPAHGGISRKRFWIPAHVAFELAIAAALILAWNMPDVRLWLLVALAAHVAMRMWSAFAFIPKALSFERADAATIDVATARRWTRRSLLRLPLDLATCGALIIALHLA